MDEYAEMIGPWVFHAEGDEAGEEGELVEEEE
jgi:hypothetical protein